MVPQVILDPKQVAKRYIKGWFFVDVASSIPFDYLTLIATRGSSGISPSLLKASRALRILRLAKMLSLLRLLRISRLLRYIQRWEDVCYCMASMHLDSLLFVVVQYCWRTVENFQINHDDVTVGSLEWLFSISYSNTSRCSSKLLDCH